MFGDWIYIDMAKWMVAAKKADFDRISEKFHISPVLARIMRNRDVIGDEAIEKFLKGDKKDLHDPGLMKDMILAADIVLWKISLGKSIRIIGDYDVDGICAAYILLMGIRALGGKADTAIPHRMKDGYGLNENLIEAAAEDGIDTIITCDNGIAAAPQIALAKEKGMTVVVTDHHEVPFEEGEQGRIYLLPRADAVVDPRQPDCTYPYKQICGAVVAAKFVSAMMDREDALPIPLQLRERLEEEMLTFGALATVCDVMELKDENRIIVKKGLALMQNTSNMGLKALLTVNGIEDKELSPYHAGFVIGPCMNATGRLDTARRALELFETTQWKDAVTIAGDLKSLNDSRREMTLEGVEEAVLQVEGTKIGRDRVLVVYLPDCHESLAGIIAGRVREKYGKPVFVLTKAEEGIKGSGRSIEAYHMYEEMTACKELFIRYGGHKMAAGLSLASEEDVDKFRRKINENCKLTKEDFEEVIHIDVPMPLSYADRDFIKELSCLEPFGVGNPRPLFARKGISLLTGRKLGKNQNVGKYRIADESGACYEMIYFGDIGQFDSFLAERFGGGAFHKLYAGGVREGEMEIGMAYYPDINYYAGKENIQIVMQYYC